MYGRGSLSAARINDRERHDACSPSSLTPRVAVARAIVVDAGVLLMDEPLSNLDALLRLQSGPS